MQAMLLNALVVCLVASSLASAPSPTTRPPSSVKSTTPSKSSTPSKSTASSKSPISTLKTTNPASPPVSPLIAALSTSRPSTPKNEQFLPIKSSSIIARSRAVPPVVRMAAGNNHNMMAVLIKDESEPEDLRDQPAIETSIGTHGNETDFLTQIKNHLRESNVDYDMVNLNGRRSLHFNRLSINDDNGIIHQSTGLTTPSKYEIRHHKRSKKHKRRKQHGDKRRQNSNRESSRNHQNDIHAILNQRHRDLYHVQRLDTQKTLEKQVFPIPKPTSPIRRVMETAGDLVDDPMIKRSHSHPQTERPLSIATRPQNDLSNVDESLDLTKSNEKGSNDVFPKFDKQGVGTKPSTIEMDFSKKKKKIERFVKFINENRVLLRNYIVEKKKKKAAMRKGRHGDKRGNARPYFRHAPAHKSQLKPQLDLSPAKGGIVRSMRAKGRICQRNVMIPEGPKYNSRGCTYMPEYERKQGQPDYPATKAKNFLIPVCCNCCKKSVLGCQ